MKPRVIERNDGEINITPMLDIVFIMLVFFIVTTSFATEQGIDVSRPTSSTTESEPRGRVLVEISENGEVSINARRIEIGSLRANVEKVRALDPDQSVVVIADRRSATGILISVLDQIRLAGMQASVAAPAGS